jgi:hypothetical protein
MPDTLSETKACDLLARLFRARGYAITRNVMFREYGVSFHIDGWDAKNRIGFEFLTSEDDDHDDLNLEEYKALMAAQQRGELSLLIMDEVEPVSEADLTATVHEFLDEVAEARAVRPARKAARGKKATKTAKKVGKKAAAVKKKTTEKKTAARPARKKAAKKKAAKKAARRR